MGPEQEEVGSPFHWVRLHLVLVLAASPVDLLPSCPISPSDHHPPLNSMPPPGLPRLCNTNLHSSMPPSSAFCLDGEWREVVVVDLLLSVDEM